MYILANIYNLALCFLYTSPYSFYRLAYANLIFSENSVFFERISLLSSNYVQEWKKDLIL